MREQRRVTEEALSRLMDAFWRLDSVQRDAKITVSSYQTYPERARTSSLVPRHHELDGQADALVTEYFATLDRYPLTEKMRPAALKDSQRAFEQLEPRLHVMTTDIERFLE